MSTCFNCGREMGFQEGLFSTTCTRCKANKIIIDANREKEYESRKNNDSSGETGCTIALLVIIAVVYFSFDYVKKWFFDPLEYTVKVEMANFREEPNQNSKIIKKLKKGSEFILLNDSSYDKGKNWGLGTNLNDTGWIYMKLVE